MHIFKNDVIGLFAATNEINGTHYYTVKIVDSRGNIGELCVAGEAPITVTVVESNQAASNAACDLAATVLK